MCDEGQSMGEYEEAYEVLNDADLPTTWTQRDGTKIAITDMGDDHLSNAAAMLRRNPTWRLSPDYRSAIREELRRRGMVNC